MFFLHIREIPRDPDAKQRTIDRINRKKKKNNKCVSMKRFFGWVSTRVTKLIISIRLDRVPRTTDVTHPTSLDHSNNETAIFPFTIGRGSQVSHRTFRERTSDPIHVASLVINEQRDLSQAKESSVLNIQTHGGGSHLW